MNMFVDKLQKAEIHVNESTENRQERVAFFQQKNRTFLIHSSIQTERAIPSKHQV